MLNSRIGHYEPFIMDSLVLMTLHTLMQSE